MSEYQQDISGASMGMLKYYLRSSDITMTAREWEVAMGWSAPPGCVAVRIRETDKGGEVTYLTAKDVVGGKNVVARKAIDAVVDAYLKYEGQFPGQFSFAHAKQWVEGEGEDVIKNQERQVKP